MWLAAFCVALSVYFKIYPIAMGLVLVVAYPKDFSWRFFAALIGLGALSFVLQRPSYVWSQYQLWVATRLADNRLQYQMDIAPRDLWMIFKTVHFPINEQIYKLLQIASGGAIAVLAVLAQFRFRWSNERTLVAIFCLVDAWMLLCGPATESATYVMLAPAAVFALVASLNRAQFSVMMRFTTFSAYAFLVAGLGVNSFLHLKKSGYVMSVQPLGALIFLGFALAWVLNDPCWESEKPASAPARENA